jgi:hypothetical protein
VLSRRLNRRFVAVCAVALLGSAALVPIRTLAGDSGTGNSGSAQLHGQDRGEGDHGHNPDNGRHQDESTGHAAKPVASPRVDTPTPGRGRGGGVSSETGGHPTPEGPANATSTTELAAPARSASSAHGVALVRGVSLPGTPVPVSHPPASNPAGGSPPAQPPSASGAAPPIPNPVLGPVPVLVPSIGATVTHPGSASPWNWLIAFAIVNAVLIAFIVIRRRRTSGPP